MVNSGCTKDNTAPISNAGNDQDIFFPIDFCNLNGVAHDRENNIQTIFWSKISGPSSFVIENPGSLSTKVSNLQIGVYQFELTVIDDKGLYGKDIIQVTVSQMPNTAPISQAGNDQYVFFPADFCTLNGVAQDLENNIQTILWSNISGPSSFLIEHPDSLSTKVSNLQIGVYQFEMFVQDIAGLTDKDTCTVIVRQMSGTPNEVIFTNQVWVLDAWWSTITINNIYQYMPAGSVFRVYIKKDNSTNWEELIMDDFNSYSWYTFSLLVGNLIIYSNNYETDTPDIKLVY